MRCSRMQIGTQMVQTQAKIYIQKKEEIFASNECYQSSLTYNEITLYKAIQLYATYVYNTVQVLPFNYNLCGSDFRY